MKALSVVIVILSINFFLNLSRKLMTKHYYKKFLSESPDMLQFYASIKRLLEKAGADEKVGYGRWANWRVSHCVELSECKTRVSQCFKKAISVYRFRQLNAYNIFYILDYPNRKLKEIGQEPKPATQAAFRFLNGAISAVSIYFLNKILGMLIPGEWFLIFKRIIK